MQKEQNPNVAAANNQNKDIHPNEQPKDSSGHDDTVHCFWCGESVAGKDISAHEEACKHRKKLKMHPFYRYLWGYGKEKAWSEICDRVLDIIKKLLEKYLFSLFLIVSIVASVVTVITDAVEYKATNLTAAEIRAEASAGTGELPTSSAEPLPSEQPALTEEPEVSEQPEVSDAPIEAEQVSINREETEALNDVMFEYTDAAFYVHHNIPAGKSPDEYFLENAVGTISGFTPVHDYVTEYFEYDLSGMAFDQFKVVTYGAISASDTQTEPVTALTHETELSQQLLSEGYHVAEYVADCYLIIGDRSATANATSADATEHMKFVFVLVEIDGAWYVASDYLIERGGA